ncbi:ATP-grasp domain-containing protein [Streptomyces tailanensis]|uniref:ATP-grasp domain-containing protein n=1 Tax=Streptomyces tailanensis TaxID=2569858 RepID=UPI00122E24CD|nr:biotin carboxylase [Streptomyces tailanensis]
MSSHILVIHRWHDRYALYDRYIDHGAHRVTYVCTDLGANSVPQSAAALHVVSATHDLAEVMAAVTDLAARFGSPDRVVALHEGDLDTAAAVRERLGCAGQDPTGLARFRDKLAMAETVAEAGVPAPAFADAPDETAVRAFARRHGWPVIVKPRRGSGSRGVVRLDSEEDLVLLRGTPAEPRLVQEFCGDAVFHVDGLWTGDRLGPWRASRYVNTCVDFTEGETLGSVEVDDAALLSAVGEFTAAAAGALSTEPWVFHVEVFVGTAGNGRPRLTFLEAGYRVGGAEIPFVWREVHGIDLMRAALEIQLGRSPDPPAPDEWRTAGWLLAPAPIPAPCRVTAWDLPTPSTPGEGPYAAIVPEIGQVIPRVPGYEHVGARFRFQGSSAAAVERAIVSTAAGFRLRCEPPVSADVSGPTGSHG